MIKIKSIYYLTVFVIITLLSIVSVNATVIFEDDFDRPNNSSLGDQWVINDEGS